MAAKNGNGATPAIDPMTGIDINAIELEDLKAGFAPIKGFLVRPTKENPRSVLFSGVLRDVVGYVDAKTGKPQNWYAFVAITDQSVTYEDADKEEHAVKKGDRIGVSETGAIKELATKKDHFVVIHYTGKQIPTKRGDMWECNVKVSKSRYPVTSTAPEAPVPFG